MTYDEMVNDDVPSFEYVAKAVKPNYRAMFDTAMVKGKEAADAHNPTPMFVGTPKTLFGNDLDTSKPVYKVDGGVCGFCWLNIPDGRSSFAKWLKKEKIVENRAYEGGYNIWIGAYGQSMEKKVAHGHAMAKYLNDNGIKCYVMSRMD